MSGAATGMVVPVTRSWAKWSASGSRRFPLCPFLQQEGEDRERAGRPGQRRDRRHRFGDGLAAQEPRRQPDRGLRRRQSEVL